MGACLLAAFKFPHQSLRVCRGQKLWFFSRGRVNPRTGLWEDVKLGVATRDAATGRKIFIDANVTCAHSGYAPRQQARAVKDGAAAADAARGKRLRYPPSGGELVPVESSIQLLDSFSRNY